MDALPETFTIQSRPLRRDTMSTISSDKQPSLPSGRWPLTIHGNCARCGHYHKAAVIQITVEDGFCEASHVICDRCGQKWLTIGGLNTTQISLLSTITTELDDKEISFRYTLFNLVRSAASVASPTALTNVPEIPSRTPSRNSSLRTAHGLPNSSTNARSHATMDHHANTASVSNIEAKLDPVPDNTARGQDSHPHLSRASRPTFGSIKRKLKNTINILRKAHFKAFTRKPMESDMATKDTEKHSIIGQLGTQRQPTVVDSAILETDNPPKEAKDVCDTPAEFTAQAMGDMKFEKEAVRKMTPKQRNNWIREQITNFKSRSTHTCDCKRRRSASIVDRCNLSETLPSQTTQSFQLYSLEQMGSQFDALPPGALFTHTGPLTISATRISEADTAVVTEERPSSPQSARFDIAQQARRSRSPRPASLVHSRHSWQPFRHARGQRDSLDSILVGSTVRNSWRGLDWRSTTSLAPQNLPVGADDLELSSLSDPVVEDDVSTTSPRDAGT